MPTDKPRLTITLPPHVYETIARMAELQGCSKSSVIAELLESVHPPLMRTVALLEAARDAPQKVRDNLRQTVEELERELAVSAGTGLEQMDMLLTRIGANTGSESGSERSESPDSDPRVVTRGSHSHGAGGVKRAKRSHGAGSGRSDGSREHGGH